MWATPLAVCAPGDSCASFAESFPSAWFLQPGTESRAGSIQAAGGGLWGSPDPRWGHQIQIRDGFTLPVCAWGAPSLCCSGQGLEWGTWPRGLWLSPFCTLGKLPSRSFQGRQEEKPESPGDCLLRPHGIFCCCCTCSWSERPLDEAPGQGKQEDTQP